MKKLATVLLLSSYTLWGLGTQAGTDITNSATLSYSAGGVTQPDIDSNTDTFKVDRKIDMILVTTDTDQTEVTPGQQDKITNYEFRNESNTNERFKFEVANLNNDDEADYDTDKDNDDVNNLEIQCTYTDGSGNSQTKSWASDFVIEIKEDTNATCQVRADIKDADHGGEDKDIMNVELKATAYKSDTEKETETTSDDTQGTEDVVFADGESVANGSDSNGLGKTESDDNGHKGDTKGNGIEVARSGYRIVTPVLSVTKTSCVISDPVNNTSHPKRIPGAIIRYMFDIKNTGTGDVNDLSLSDDIDSKLLLGNTKNSAKKDENGTDACVCSTNPSKPISSDVTINDQNVKIEHINVEHGSTQTDNGEKHTCVAFEVEID